MRLLLLLLVLGCRRDPPPNPPAPFGSHEACLEECLDECGKEVKSHAISCDYSCRSQCQPQPWMQFSLDAGVPDASTVGETVDGYRLWRRCRDVGTVHLQCPPAFVPYHDAGPAARIADGADR